CRRRTSDASASRCPASDKVAGRILVEAPGLPGVLRTVSFAKGETDEGLDVAQPIVVEGELLVIRHPARGEFPAVVELQVRKAGRAGGVWNPPTRWRRFCG